MMAGEGPYYRLGMLHGHLGYLDSSQLALIAIVSN